MSQYQLDDLLYLMSRLREPMWGCPWDLKQSYATITPSTVEEVYEVVDTIEREDYGHLKEELGDLLFQIVFYGQLASEDNLFAFKDVVHEITAKLLRRHPHVFPDGTLQSRRSDNDDLDDAKIKASWEAIKREERESKGAKGILDDIPAALPSITRAAKLQKRASQVGFDWQDVEPVLDKLGEEITELKQAIAESKPEEIQSELGDILFTCVNVARHLKVEPEQSLRLANAKFEQRFKFVETQLKESGASFEESTEEELDRLWNEAKKSGL